MQNSTNVHQQLQNMLYTPILLRPLRVQKHNLLARRRLRGLVVFVFAHDTQIQVAHALCKQGCRLLSYTANTRLVTIEVCYNCPRSPHISPTVFLVYLLSFPSFSALFSMIL